MEESMAKKSGVLPKESGVIAHAELQQKLWAAVPMRPGENLKAWFPRVAAALGWTVRRVRAYWNGEVRRIEYAEIVTLDQRIQQIDALKEKANGNRARLNDLIFARHEIARAGQAHRAGDPGSGSGGRHQANGREAGLGVVRGYSTKTAAG
jgi:hypothetical protein